MLLPRYLKCWVCRLEPPHLVSFWFYYFYFGGTVFFFFFFSPGWPGTHYIAWADLEVAASLPALASRC